MICETMIHISIVKTVYQRIKCIYKYDLKDDSLFDTDLIFHNIHN